MNPSIFYHVYNRANGNENLFRNDENYHFFLKKFAYHINPIANTYAYCLMPNHFHFLLRIREEEELVNHFRAAGKTFKVLEDLEGFTSGLSAIYLTLILNRIIRFMREKEVFLFLVLRKKKLHRISISLM